MKIILLGFCLILLSVLSNAQGLENIIVEKYYVSNGNDTTVNSSGGVLPVGSVTYRIYVDMLTGYKFQAAYGIQDASGTPLHTLTISTTTLFFNNEDRGATSPTYSKNQAKNNTVMLDSWLSVGAACAGNFGILKTDDDGISTIVNNDVVLQNNSPFAGIPLTSQDGLIAGVPEQLTSIGISSEIAMFDNQNDGTNGPTFSTSNGSWASLNGSTGPTADNRVLIAQMTTDGVFSFSLNIQIGTPTGFVENYVAVNPTGNEILFPACNYSSATSQGIKDIMSTTSKTILNVFPNPSNGSTIKLEIIPTKKSENNSYKVYDIIGNVIVSKVLGKITDKYIETVDVSSLQAGQYFVEVSLDGIKSTKKIVKF